MTSNESCRDLISRLSALQSAEPGIRARNAAARLGVSEGELVAARCGIDAARLKPNYQSLLQSLVKVGQVLVITRNDFAVNEKRGYYSHLNLSEHGGGAFDHNVNLRYFFHHWAHGFAVTEGGSHSTRKSFQLFDSDGTSVHKIYQTDNGDPQAWDKLVDEFRAEDQTPAFSPAEPTQAYVPQAAELADADVLREQWRAITDIHQFWPMLRDHKLRRVDAIRLARHELTRPVAADAWRAVLQNAAQAGLPIMIFTASPGVAQIHTGPIHRIVEKDGWFNVLDPTFNLHLRSESVSEAWVVHKPTASGGQTSLELFHENGQLISHIFGAVNLDAPQLRGWQRLLDDIPTLGPASATRAA